VAPLSGMNQSAIIDGEDVIGGVSGKTATSGTLCDDGEGSSDGVGDPGVEGKPRCMVSCDSANHTPWGL
jgi:hypothetical protein